MDEAEKNNNIISFKSDIELIKDIENRYPVKEWSINGVKVWPMIRIQLSTKLIPTGYLVKQNSFLGTIALLIKNYFLLIKSFVLNTKSFSNINNSDVSAVFLNNTGCRRETNKKWVDVFCDPIRIILEKLNYRTIAWEWNNSEYHFPRNMDSSFISFRIDWIKIRSRLFSNNKYRFKFEKFEELNKELAGLLDLQQIKYSSILIYEFEKFFLEKFKKISPRFGFTSIYYNEIGMGFILACKRKNILTIDIQHGRQDEQHIAYNWNPTDKYAVLPDVFLGYGEIEKQNVFSWGNKEYTPVTMGHLWADEWKNENNVFVKYYDEKINNLKNNRTNILYSLGYEKIPLMMLEIMKKTANTCQWWIRLHPGDKNRMFERRLELKGISNFILDESVNYPLEALLRHMDVNITEFSSVVLESEFFGVSSILINPAAKKYFKPQLKSKMALIGTSVDEIESLIFDQAKKSKEYRKNSCEKVNKNFVKELEELWMKMNS